MQAFSSGGEKDAEVGLVAERFQQLYAGRTGSKEGDPDLWEPLFAGKRKAEC